METTIYKSPEGKARILDLYDSFQKGLGVAFDDRLVNTRFGATHVLVAGPEQGPPVVITHGGNSITPQGLRGLLPLLQTGCYRVYAPDTLGHPGKSAQTRLSPRDQSYGQWLNDLLDGLGLDSAAFIEDDVLQLIEAVFQHVRVEAGMPRPATKAEVEGFTAPACVIAAIKDVMFPRKAVAKRAKEIFSNLTVVECPKGATHYSAKPDLEYVNKRIVEFLER
jgi:pimeloyl-ACP methyl ester carboxylesterase